jgi:hypothetical protein
MAPVVGPDASAHTRIFIRRSDAVAGVRALAAVLRAYVVVVLATLRALLLRETGFAETQEKNSGERDCDRTPHHSPFGSFPPAIITGIQNKAGAEDVGNVP